MDILWSLVFIHYITFKLKNLFFFIFLLLDLIWCRSGEIVVGQADFSSPPDRLSCKVWETFVNSACRSLRCIPNYRQISVIWTSIIRNYWVIQRLWTVPTFFYVYCNKTTDYSNFNYQKNSIFRSDSLFSIKEIAIKLLFKIRSPKCHAWWSWFLCFVEFDLHTRVIKQTKLQQVIDTGLTFTLLRDEPLSDK